MSSISLPGVPSLVGTEVYVQVVLSGNMLAQGNCLPKGSMNVPRVIEATGTQSQRLRLLRGGMWAQNGV